MRHQKQGRKFGRKADPRRAFLRSMVTGFVLSKGKVQVTISRAKEIRPIVEKLITLSKDNTLASRRKLLSYLYDEKAVNRLLTEWGPKYLERQGGYTRIIKVGKRVGDDAEEVILELV